MWVRMAATTPDAQYNAALLHPTFGGYNSDVLWMDSKVCPTKFPQLGILGPSICGQQPLSRLCRTAFSRLLSPLLLPGR